MQSDALGLDDVEDKIQLALDLTDVRMMMEPEIAALAAHNRTDEEAALLTEYCEAVRRKIEAGEDYIVEDMRFHWYLGKCSHNMVIESLMPIIDTAVISIANITRKELLNATIDTHQEILEGVIDRDPQAARAAMSMHIDMNRIFIRQAEKTRKITVFRTGAALDRNVRGRFFMPQKVIRCLYLLFFHVNPAFYI